MALLSSFSTTNSQNTQETNANEETYVFDWSSSLIPRPLCHTTDLIKSQLPVTEYNICDGQEDECAVCLNVMEAKQVMRKLKNCVHVFHKDCIDGWIDRNNVSCPLCRADLHQSRGVETIKSNNEV